MIHSEVTHDQFSSESARYHLESLLHYVINIKTRMNHKLVAISTWWVTAVEY